MRKYAYGCIFENQKSKINGQDESIINTRRTEDC